MTKEFKYALHTRSALENKMNKIPAIENITACKNQQN